MERDDLIEAGDDGLLRFTPVDAGSAIVLTSAGEVDLETGPRLRAALARLLERPDAVPIVVDLTDVTFLGSTGIAVLVDAHWQAVQLNIPLSIVVASDGAVHRTLRTAGVDRHLKLHHDLGAALREIGAG
ncbi:MAG TPA: anti-sigma factor antagonist [Pseudonocardia sp.]|jgi:anti-sigma B factor antagonist|uniref:anti-sigma factor antagonist n=1 Tax=Pseudonocardia sp. TaxID=60912 RepID=UPI002EDA378E